jgi:D-tyrosyl-tRNA(Tyr) deacylase
MRLIIQRVSQASLKAEDGHSSEINKGLFVLVGITQTDTEKEVKILAKKLFKLRVMDDEEGKLNLAVKDVKGAEFLVVSQFTLYGDTSGGNRPSFIKAARPEQAEPLYELFIQTLKDLGATVKTGSFGNHMDIDSQLDGPVTIVMES